MNVRRGHRHGLLIWRTLIPSRVTKVRPVENHQKIAATTMSKAATIGQRIRNWDPSSPENVSHAIRRSETPNTQSGSTGMTSRTLHGIENTSLSSAA